MPKNIVVFSDGTGQDGGARPEQRTSNVYKLYKASQIGYSNDIHPSEQVTFYDPGLGTDIGATALTSPARFIQKLLASVTGRGITTNIADCYEFIINHYQPGDRIYLIGFSRGAYTVRCVANLLMLCGVPTKAETGPLLRFRKAVRDIADDAVSTVLEHGAGHPRAEYEDERMEQARRFREKHGSNDLDGEAGRSNAAPYFIGVFDTVAALGAKGLLRKVLQIGFGLLAVLAIALISALPVAAILGVLHVFLSFHFWRAFFSVLAVTEVVGGLYLWRRQRLSYRKTIRDFRNYPPPCHGAQSLNPCCAWIVLICSS